VGDAKKRGTREERVAQAQTREHAHPRNTGMRVGRTTQTQLALLTAAALASGVGTRRLPLKFPFDKAYVETSVTSAGKRK
jgi:hypothetical protein